MYNQPYFVPSYFSSIPPSMMRGTMNSAMMGSRGVIGNAMSGLSRTGLQGTSKGLGLFARLGNSMQAIKNVNWGGLITNTSKTLNVVNQAIPLIRQVGPMMNNMKSMLRIASIFKDETDRIPTNRRNQVTNSPNNNNSNYVLSDNTNTRSNVQSNSTELRSQSNIDGAPTFFIDT